MTTGNTSILFAATLLCARKLQELASDRPSLAKIAAVENAISRATFILDRIDRKWPSEFLMAPSFEATLIEVWRQALVENAKSVRLGPESYPVGRTSKRGLRQVDFVFEGEEMRGLEASPKITMGVNTWRTMET